MKRRRFIYSAIAATAVLIFPVIHYRCRNSYTANPLKRPVTLACFCDEETIREIGDHYLSMTSYGVVKKPILERMIMTGYDIRLASVGENAELTEWIEKKVVQDYASNKIVIVDGWMLSETEACQCALLSLG